MRKFTKNDQGFTCQNCGTEVPPLGCSSRDHCTKCLYSIHVDINPGDRANPCRAPMKPVGVTQNRKHGYVIHYQCTSCGKAHNCRMAPDDDFDAILAASKIVD